MIMDENLRKYYENRNVMCNSDAWRDLMEDVDKMVAATNTLDGISNEAILKFRQGEISIMRWLLALKDTSEKTYNNLIKEENESS